MSRRATYLSLFSLFLIDQLQAQTGAGCFLKTCSTPGQVRIDAQFDAQTGAFMGGCHCSCPPEMSEPSSPRFCAEPKILNFDPATLTGDCSCQCPVGIGYARASDCKAPQQWDPVACECECPSWAPLPNDCVAPQTFLPTQCTCGCEIGSIGGPCNGAVSGQQIPGSFVTADCTCDTTLVSCPGNQRPDATGNCACPEQWNGQFYPICGPGQVKDPLTCDCITTTTTRPPVGPIDVACENPGDCGCPFGTAGTCTITCDVGNDACKDGTIKCNNDGHDCTVKCLSPSACAGAATILGPARGKLTVTCSGSKACEGATKVDGESSTDVTVKCEGSQSCKGNVAVRFGTGFGRLECYGSPDACLGMDGGSLILAPNARNTAGAGFNCVGNCPPGAPAPFSNAVSPTPPQWVPQQTIPQPQPNPVVPTPVVPAPAPQTTASSTGLPPGIVQPQIPDPQQPYVWRPVVPTPTAPLPPTRITPAPTHPIAPGGPGAQGGNLVFQQNPPIPIVQPDEIVICAGGRQTCECSNTRACTIKCEEQDDCKESTLTCGADHECTIVCMGTASCVVTTINGPIGKDFTLNCAGAGSCVDSDARATEALNVAYTCSGKDACKGAGSTLNCGSGNCEVSCSGESACDAAEILPNHAQAFMCSGVYFEHCPPSFTAPPIAVPTSAPTVPTPPCAGVHCSCGMALQCFERPNEHAGCECECPLAVLAQEFTGNPHAMCGAGAPGQVYLRGGCACDCPPGTSTNCPPGLIFNQNLCQCECPGGNEQCHGKAVMNTQTCQCECPKIGTPTASDCAALGKVMRDCECQCPLPCPGAGQLQSPITCQCSCPIGTPRPQDCVSGILDELNCECAPLPPSPFCCHTQIDGFIPWRGRCWGLTTEDACNAEPNSRCIWKGETVEGRPNPNKDCLPNPPVNNLWPHQGCAFRDEVCSRNEECCSEVCRINGLCR
eukprot:CAMPEP_0197077200 /NCGR_PEP_ID=MMETSP1384-20130603/212497_1 /TAXON_ID=29189 /ORGANISM="Ammonia sp." /LENGTH=950 /DNA_ID=CAMNT_0042516061 /DNA_START=72 /DNA_END=2924 /DNA_ORIENTATION=-